MNDKTLEIAKGYVELGKPIPANHGQTLITRIEALEAALRGLLGKEVAEERIGWRGLSPSNPDLYQCEYCHKEHYDCTEIEHLDDCPILEARKALEGSSND